MSWQRRGVCPTLQDPMPTGDGLLARLRLAQRALNARQLAGIARAAAEHGNGIVEISARGNLQIRGLRHETVAPFGQALARLALADETGLVVETGPLAGLDALERCDPRPLADAIRTDAAAFAGRLGPKVAVTVDAEGALTLGGIVADIALRAGDDEWRLCLAGRDFGPFTFDQARQAVERLLAGLARAGPQARIRDLSFADLLFLGEGRPVSQSVASSPVGVFALKGGGRARGLAPAFGRIEAEALARFGQDLGRARLRLAPGRGLLVLDGDDTAVLPAAARAGLVTQVHDPRLRVTACAGAPACASAELATQTIAARLSTLGLAHAIHVSGCDKGCAAPRHAHLALVGRPGGCDMRDHDIMSDETTRAAVRRAMEDV